MIFCRLSLKSAMKESGYQEKSVFLRSSAIFSDKIYGVFCFRLYLYEKTLTFPIFLCIIRMGEWSAQKIPAEQRTEAYLLPRSLNS
jgi:hypothetical protein